MFLEVPLVVLEGSLQVFILMLEGEDEIVVNSGVRIVVIVKFMIAEDHDVHLLDF